MAKKPTTEVVEVPEFTEEAQHVTVHLDRDPNDPRNRPETNPLPSLDD